MSDQIEKQVRKIEKTIESITHKYTVVENMTNGEINKGLDRLDEASSILTNIFIEVGRGYERPSETFKLNDPLALLSKALFDLTSILRREVSRRYGPSAPSRLPTGKRK